MTDIAKIVAASQDELARAEPNAARGPAVLALLQHVASVGASRVPWEGGLREVFLFEVRQANNRLLLILKAKADAGAKSFSNQQRHDRQAEIDEFEADSQYMLGEMQGLPAAPFTSQRLAELLLSPLQYHTTAAVPLSADSFAGVQLASGSDDPQWASHVELCRPKVVQNALRKCVLVAPTGVC